MGVIGRCAASLAERYWLAGEQAFFDIFAFFNLGSSCFVFRDHLSIRIGKWSSCARNCGRLVLLSPRLFTFAVWQLVFRDEQADYKQRCRAVSLKEQLFSSA